MIADPAVHVFARPEAWTARDHDEWSTALVEVGFAPDRGVWRSPVDVSSGAVRVRVALAPEDGRFVLAVSANGSPVAPAEALRVVLPAVERLTERVDVEFGQGFFVETPPRPRGVADVRALAIVNVLGPDLVLSLGWARVLETAGFEVRPLASGGVLMHRPLDGFTGAWTSDEEARYLEAEMHLGLRLDASRYRRLAGPARSYLSRRFGSA